MTEKIGFIGLGNMGHALAQNLLADGYDLKVYNRTPDKADDLVKKGAILVSKPAEVVSKGGIVISVLSNDQAVEEIVFGKGGILPQMKEDTIHLSISTLGPDTARKLAKAHEEYGSKYVSSPVFGRPDAAATRTLWVCTAGPQAAKERVQPILQALSQGVYDFGEDVGAANIVKLAGNFMIVSAMEAMAEALTLGEKNGIERSALINMLTQTIFTGRIYQNYGQAISQKRYMPAGFFMELGLKDINLALKTAEEANMPMPLASLLRDRFMVGMAKGREKMDWSALSLGVSEDAGLPEE
ncbi:MAG TPA: NAD(P)-dependent oxidoreductase [Ktedonobacteraceae bacterium]|nr:NAD(P)-dependent oxidoreductase [Ktedonobacteraceae bacterium]